MRSSTASSSTTTTRSRVHQRPIMASSGSAARVSPRASNQARRGKGVTLSLSAAIVGAQVLQKSVDRGVPLRTVALGRGGLPELGDRRAGEHGVSHLCRSLEGYLEVLDHEAERESVVEGAVEDVPGELDLGRIAPSVARVEHVEERLRCYAGPFREDHRLCGARERRRREQVVKRLDQVPGTVVADVEDLGPERPEDSIALLVDLPPPPYHHR